jgi:hypothetical protein
MKMKTNTCYITSLIIVSLIPAGVNAQKNPILNPQRELASLKALEIAIKDPCLLVNCPSGKICNDGCCIYPLTKPAEGNWNYIIYNNCEPMNNLKLSFKVTKDLEAEYDLAANCAQTPSSTDQKFSSTAGVVVQFNCYSKDVGTQQNSGGMVQYIFYIQGQSVYPHIQYVSGTPDGLDHDWARGNNTFPGLQLPKANTLPAGYTVEVAFGTGTGGYVDDVTFTVIDNNRKSYVLNAPKAGTHPAGSTSAAPETIFPLRIIEFQSNVVSTDGRYVHFKPGGEGTLAYSSSDILCVEGGNYAHCAESGAGTCESSNASYGFLSSCCTEAGKSFSQSVITQ